MQKTILVTGASGLLGSSVVNFFLERKYKVYAIVRTTNFQTKASVLRINLEECNAFDAIENCPKFDLIVHCAYNFYDKRIDVNVNYLMSINVIKFSKINGCKNVINISTLSAFKDAVSSYGKIKFNIEKIFASVGYSNVRLGVLIQSPKVGIDKIAFDLASIPIPVLLSIKTTGYTFVTETNKFCAYLERLLISEKRVFATFSFVDENPVSLLSLMKKYAVNKFVIGLDWKFFYFILKAMEKLGLKIRFGSDSLLGLTYSIKTPERNLYEHE